MKLSRMPVDYMCLPQVVALDKASQTAFALAEAGSPFVLFGTSVPDGLFPSVLTHHWVLLAIFLLMADPADLQKV